LSLGLSYLRRKNLQRFLGEFRTSVRGTFVTEQKYPKISLKPAVLRIPCFCFSFFASLSLGLSVSLRPTSVGNFCFCADWKERSVAASAKTCQVSFLWRSNSAQISKHSSGVCALRKTKLCPFLPAERLMKWKAREAAQQKRKNQGRSWNRRFRAAVCLLCRRGQRRSHRSAKLLPQSAEARNSLCKCCRFLPRAKEVASGCESSF